MCRLSFVGACISLAFYRDHVRHALAGKIVPTSEYSTSNEDSIKVISKQITKHRKG